MGIQDVFILRKFCNFLLKSVAFAWAVEEGCCWCPGECAGLWVLLGRKTDRTPRPDHPGEARRRPRPARQIRWTDTRKRLRTEREPHSEHPHQVEDLVFCILSFQQLRADSSSTCGGVRSPRVSYIHQRLSRLVLHPGLYNSHFII